jgi:hypothetical protein
MSVQSKTVQQASVNPGLRDNLLPATVDDEGDDFDSDNEEEMDGTARKSLCVSVATLLLSIPALIGA